MKKLFFSALLLVFSQLPLGAQSNYCKHQNPNPGTLASVNDTRSDSIDIVKTTINLTITDFANQQISGNAAIDFKAKVNGINILRLDLIALTVDSVLINGNALVFDHTAEIIRIQLPTTYNAQQGDLAVVYYHGTPVTDASGYGGFDFSGQYAYSIGVGFEAIPHNFGRCWYPCFDNFVERCLFDFNITTSTANTAVCNGTLLNTTDNGNGTRTFFWSLAEEIPSYLSCVAVAPYVSVTDSYPTVAGGNIPVLMHCLAIDSTKLKNSFANLDVAFATFEDRFGPYRWERVGYVLVPFQAGAMEHTTCISYPTFLVNGQTTYESTMAHELAHMWFGNLVTCDKAEEMYLNEGFADYCQYVFYEGLIGYNRYIGEIRNNHRKVLNFSRALDGDFYAISNVPQTVTYGSTTYEKGADVIHTLRSYMGDSLFFGGLKYYLNNNMFDDVNSDTLQRDLEDFSGFNLDDFFTDWVHQPGFPQFSVDSFHVAPSGQNYTVTTYIHQRLHHANTFAHNVPFNITFRGADWATNSQPALVSGEFTTLTHTVPFVPVMTNLNTDDRISHAVTTESKVFKQTGSVSMVNAFMSINPISITDSAFVIVEHNWVAADNHVDNTDNVVVSPDRFWRVTGIAPEGFVAKAVLGYNGRTTGTSSGWLDHGLITGGEDSLILLYRPSPFYPWKKYSNAVKNTQGGTTDKIGRFDVDTLRFGEYCFGKGEAAVNVPENAFKANKLVVYPNPATSVLTIQSDVVFEKGAEISIINAMGVLVNTLTVPDVTDRLQINLNNLPADVYYLRTGTSYARFVVM